MDASITTREAVPGHPDAVTRIPADLNIPITLGRDAHLSLGVADRGMSRIAATVTLTTEGWAIDHSSRNGLVLFPWGLAASRATGRTMLHWPLIGLRLLSSDPTAQYWALLEDPGLPATESARPHRVRTTTARGYRPPALTGAETEALTTVFADALAWPPRLDAEPRQLKQAARLLNITASAVKVRLEGARQKAEALGLTRHVGVTDPSYLHVLVAAGYLTPPASTRPDPAPEQA